MSFDQDMDRWMDVYYNPIIIVLLVMHEMFLGTRITLEKKPECIYF